MTLLFAAYFVGALSGLVLLALLVRQWLSESSPGPVVSGVAPGAAPEHRISVCFTAPSSAVFHPGSVIRIVQLALPDGAVNVEISTRYLDGWGPILEPIAASAKGTARSNADFVADLSARLHHVGAVLSLSANAWVGELNIAGDGAVFGLAPLEATVRELDEEATGTLIERIGIHPDSQILREILECYRRALGFWRPGAEAVALSHLHEGLSGMAEILIRHFCQSWDIARSELAKTRGVAQKDLTGQILAVDLYQNDALTLHAGGLACRSIGEGGEPVSTFAQDAHLAAARYLRESILRVLALDPDCHSRLLASPFDVPLGASLDAPAVRTQARRMPWELLLPATYTASPTPQPPYRV